MSFFRMVLLGPLFSGALLSAAACDGVTNLTFPNTTVTSASIVAAGAWRTPSPGGQRPWVGDPIVDPAQLPAFCRVAFTLTPAPDSVIKAELWLPVSGWNGKLMAIGNGGFTGVISFERMAGPLSRHYAVASTDTGHEGDATFAIGHPEKVVDWAHRAVHEMTDKSKKILTAYYGSPARYSYWNGCSTGGRQGLMEVQRYPADFDGVIASSASINITHLSAQQLWVAQKAREAIPADKLPMLRKAVLDACDILDLAKDGLLENPAQCKFDPAALLCKTSGETNCLSQRQVETARLIYGPVVNPRTGDQIYPGLSPGSEGGWGGYAGPPTGPSMDYYGKVLFQNTAWDFRTFDFYTGVAKADSIHGALMNANSTDMKAFFARGGKLLQLHGWSDPQISPQNTVDFYNSVPGKSASSYRLFMVPGMFHCRGGDGINSLDAIDVIEQWVEHGKAPERIEGVRLVNGKAELTHPLCPYPQVAVYKGSGDIAQSSNFTCQAQ